MDCNKYLHALKVGNVAELLLDQYKVPQLEKIGSVSVATQIPIIAVAHYFGHLYGYSSQLYAYIVRLCEFYDVKEVVHFEDSLRK